MENRARRRSPRRRELSIVATSSLYGVGTVSACVCKVWGARCKGVVFCYHCHRSNFPLNPSCFYACDYHIMRPGWQSCAPAPSGTRNVMIDVQRTTLVTMVTVFSWLSDCSPLPSATFPRLLTLWSTAALNRKENNSLIQEFAYSLWVVVHCWLHVHPTETGKLALACSGKRPRVCVEGGSFH